MQCNTIKFIELMYNHRKLEDDDYNEIFKQIEVAGNRINELISMKSINC